MNLDLNKVKIAMARNCYSMDELTAKTGLGRSTISKTVNGKVTPSTKTVGLIAKALNVDVTELI